MSNRSTPGPSYRPSISSSATGSGRRKSSRQLSISSTHNTSLGESFRRPSTTSHRKASQISVSGASISETIGPYGRRRSNKALQDVPEGETDWSAVEPDEIFRRLPAGEVKRVESKMREEATNKQSELRSMVGTRYRDLLTSATQIIALRESSLRLSSSLKRAVHSCASPQDIEVTRAPSETSEGEEVMSLLPVAAHMKLLLDTPESLYSFLAHHAFLKAAFLWLVARVVKESLAAMPEDVNAPYIALLNKQWETLPPFRGQIVQRATASLRSREPLDAKTLSETLLAIILLDNLSIPDALSLFLTQRTKTLRDILCPESSGHTRTRRDSRVSVRSMSKERDEIGSVLGEAVKSLLETVNLVRAVFDKRQGAESLINEMQKSVQMGQPLSSPAKELGPNRTIHERRASRLASMSIAMPHIPTAGGAPISAPQILQALPSAQILLRHLPSNIISFTPFIAPSSTPDLDAKLEEWQGEAIMILRDAGPEWLNVLPSVADVWGVRSSLNGILQSGNLESQIRSSLDEEWSKRIEQIWDKKLEELVQLAEAKTRELAEKVGKQQDEMETNPESFIFAELAFPPNPSHALTASSVPFNQFLTVVKKRAASRTPALDEVLLALETATADLRQDMHGLPPVLHEEYGKKARVILQKLVEAFRRVAESFTSPAEGLSIEAQMFVGRVAIYLAKQSECLLDLAGETSTDLGQFKSDLVAVHALSMQKWRRKSIDDAIATISAMLERRRDPEVIATTWQGPQPVNPSAAIMVSLNTLVTATRQLGLPPNADLTVVKDLVQGYIEAVRAIPAWESAEAEVAAQSAFDLSFLSLFMPKDTDEDALIQKLIRKIPSSLPANFVAELPNLAADHLRRTQVLLRPLLQHVDVLSVALPPSGSDMRNGLLRFGAPKGSSGVGTEFRSPLAVAKPGKRFGLLSVAA